MASLLNLKNITFTSFEEHGQPRFSWSLPAVVLFLVRDVSHVVLQMTSLSEF